MKRPNPNAKDACCRCGALLPTAVDLERPGDGELRVYQPNIGDPPQWICGGCDEEITKDPAVTMQREEEPA